MSFDLVKFERGQVWMIRFRRQESNGREQSKDRPWLILSVGKFNHSAGMITAVPITSRDSISTPAQVLFTNHMGKRNVILCEQIRSFDYQSGAYTFDFMGTLSDKVLESVDVALSIHLGLHYSPISLRSLYDSIESVVKSIVSLNTPTSKFDDSDVVDFAQKLRSITLDHLNIGSVAQEEITTCDVDLEVPPPHCVPKEPPAPEPPKDVKKRKRITWTPDLCREYLRDVEQLPMKEVMKKWEIEKKTRVYSLKHYVQSLIAKE